MRWTVDGSGLNNDKDEKMFVRVKLVSTTTEKAERPSDTKGSDPEGGSGSPVRNRQVRNRQVRFTLPRQPRIGVDLSSSVGGHAKSASSQLTPTVDPSAVHPSIHSTGTELLSCGTPLGSIPMELTPVGNQRGQTSSLQRTFAGDPRGQSSSLHCTPTYNPRGQSSSLQCTPAGDP
ncbi:hypothetical protein QYF36_010816 [Acer negundo]|nr:hypothetical protein QYF36_010816 [Acer negundo]